ncbi:hypothetical protein [Polyangium sp. y55x31]|uniref:hypothetical protein n=1 Tax=Polyangium sp. y55x31 TaxID=3042688 RepID=UPI0024825283|nr:hypothetical protein [Polyangium sp. y55x31]MDI1482011.1 hypothetical protein [Polyangium sp. y55x31]
MNNAIWEILDHWGLLSDDFRPGRYSMKDWKRMAEALERSYTSPIEQVLSSVHLGLSQGTRVAEGHEPPQDIAAPVVMFERVCLPDPVFSFFSRTAAKAWELLPESGSVHLIGKRSIHTAPSSFWTVPTTGRRTLVDKTLPQMLRQLKELRPLVEVGAIALVPWEPILLRDANALHEATQKLARSQYATELTQRYNQIEYNYGVRVGAIGIEMKDPPPGSNTAPGEPLWWEEKRPMLHLGLLNAAFSKATAASFLPDRPGDRAVYDFARSGGRVTQPTQPIAEHLTIPAFSKALWPDIVALRKNSVALAELRAIIRDASAIDDETSIPVLRNRLDEAAARLKEDASLWKAVKSTAQDAAIMTTISGGGGYLAAGPDAAFIATLGGGAVSFLMNLARAKWNPQRTATQDASELLVRLSDNLSPK